MRTTWAAKPDVGGTNTKGFEKGECHMLLDTFGLDGEVAIVTGAGGGLGRALSLALVEAGAKVVVVDVVEVNGEETVREIVAAGGEGIFIKADLTKGDEVKRMAAETAKRFGKIDILVNNAGTVLGKPLIEVEEEEWHRVMDINLTSTFLCSRFAGKYMIERGKGKIINISSNAGIAAATNQSAYCASKAGVISLTKCLALEWARYHINVNAIAPGYIRTALSASALENEKIASILLKKIPLRRFAEPEDIAPLVIYLASKASEYMTGETILIDGGHLSHL
jgi:NAD(P)-dependent dehydrogenase (short-subunit alcohol dehydrogenase family)